ncbi:MAG: hypothetical protein M3063_06710 [Actinomycetota bacterium]|nr:hypothetical protein [Actinomycetota bacterium]
MTGDDPHGPWTFDDAWMTTHPDRPLVDDATAAVLDEAVVELTLLRSPMSLGDGLADLHAMASLLAQLHAWMPLSVAAARKHEHTWEAIGRQLGVTATTARKRHRAHISRPPDGPQRPVEDT